MLNLHPLQKALLIVPDEDEIETVFLLLEGFEKDSSFPQDFYESEESRKKLSPYALDALQQVLRSANYFEGLKRRAPDEDRCKVKDEESREKQVAKRVSGFFPKNSPVAKRMTSLQARRRNGVGVKIRDPEEEEQTTEKKQLLNRVVEEFDEADELVADEAVRQAATKLQESK